MAASRRFHRSLVTGALAASMAVAGVAMAGWTTTSDGQGSATIGSLQPVTASSATPTKALLPGGSADAAVTLTNPNSVAMTVNSIVRNGAITTSSAACNATNPPITFVDQPSGAWAIGPNTNIKVSLTDAVRLGATADTSCQGATVMIPVRVTAAPSGGSTTPSSTVAPTSTTSTTSVTPTTVTGPQALSWSSQHGSPSNFGQVPVGYASIYTYTLTNSSSATVNGVTASLGMNDGGFAIVNNNCTSVSLPAGQGCAVQVRFAPQTTGTKAARLDGNGQGVGTASFNMTGTGMAAAKLALTPTTYDFGSQAFGSQTSASFIVKNEGWQTTSALTFQIVGANAAEFVITPGGTCGPSGTTTLVGAQNGGTPCTIVVSFKPQTAGSKSATLQVSASIGGTVTSTLSGTAF